MNDLPPLTLLESFLLLALDEKTGTFRKLSRGSIDTLTIGATLMDLMLRRHIDYDLHNIFVINGAPTGDDLLDPMLQPMTLAPVLTPYPISHWLEKGAPEGEALREKALKRLEKRGILRRDDGKKIATFEGRRYQVLDNKEPQIIRARLDALVLSEDIPAPHDMMLVSLGQACGLFLQILEESAHAKAVARIERIARMDLIGQAVAKAVTAGTAA